jgi:hypothetical protein
MTSIFIDEAKLKPLMDYISNTYSGFKKEIDAYLSKIEE